jgi:HrpA-like RNA helicase
LENTQHIVSGVANVLPIASYRSKIISAVRENRVVVITAETGAGKSTQVPQYLLAEGYNLVVTQPRRLAARTVSARVASELGEKLGETVGVRTRDDNVQSPATRCLFATDGLALVRELLGVGRHNVLVLDEVHEWNLNIEVLVAWAKLQLERGADFKVVLMSATLEAQKLAAYFGGTPVIEVPGRTFPVEEQDAGRDLSQDVADLLSQGRNVLVFQPGKAEIAKTVSDLKEMQGLRAEILPLHGELTPDEQQAAFKKYKQPKCVIATNVAQTSITIDDIDAVVDSGLERRIELVNGVEGLYLEPISLADAKQRKGRAGRTKPGIYIDHCDAGYDRLEFPKAEILRTRLDQTVLRLAEAGIDAEELTFFHQPDRTAIHEAKRALKALGCMGPDGEVTRKGQRVSKMPISVETACMVIEAEKRGVVDDVLTIAAILEIGEITSRKDEKGNPSLAWRELCPSEVESDLLAQLSVFKAAGEIKKEDLRKRGVHVKAYFQAKEVRRHLAESLRGKVRDFRSSGKREDILRSVCAGMVDHLYAYDSGEYRNGDGISRQLNRESVIGAAEWLVGIPWDLQIKTRRGGMVTLHLVRMATKVNPDWLAEVAPQLVEKKLGLRPRYDSLEDAVVSTTQVCFNGRVVKEETVKDTEHPDAADLFCAWLAGQMV